MSCLSKVILNVQESATFVVKSKALLRKAAGKPVFDLSTGEPEFPMPEHITEGIYHALKAGRTRYTAVAGIPELRAALVQELKTKTGLDFDKDKEVLVTNGGKQGLFMACACLLEEGDEAIIPIPYWVSYPQMVKLAGASVKYLAPQHDLKISPKSLREAITHSTKVLILNSPSNPSGAVYTDSELRALGEVINGTDIIVIWDAVYDEVCFSASAAPEWLKVNPHLRDQTVYINSFSKTFAMTGLRVGYVAGPEELVSAMLRHQNQSTSNVCTPAQYGALAALSNPRDFIRNWTDTYQRRASTVVLELRKIPGVKVPCLPAGAFYVLAEVGAVIEQRSEFATAEDLAADLIERTGVAVVPGDAFGVPSMLRLSLTTTDDQMHQALNLLGSYCRAS